MQIVAEWTELSWRSGAFAFATGFQPLYAVYNQEIWGQQRSEGQSVHAAFISQESSNPLKKRLEAAIRA